MTAIMRTDAKGLACGLLVLREVVSFGDGPSLFRGQKPPIARTCRPASETCVMRVVSRNLNDFLDD